MNFPSNKGWKGANQSERFNLSIELKTKISLNPDEGSYLGSILDQLEGIIENPKNIKHMASQIPKTIERVHDDLKENHPRATAIVLQVPN